MPWSALLPLDALAALCTGCAAPPRRRSRRAPDTTAADTRWAAPTPMRPTDDEHAACGWFESSHVLTRGLQVTEHAQPEAVAQLVPLRWWLAWELDAAAPPGPPRPAKPSIR